MPTTVPFGTWSREEKIKELRYCRRQLRTYIKLYSYKTVGWYNTSWLLFFVQRVPKKRRVEYWKPLLNKKSQQVMHEMIIALKKSLRPIHADSWGG